MVHIPIKKLTEGTREVANLNLDYRVKLNSRDELGDLAESFNEMTSRLKAADESIKSWSAQLEEKVREKTEETQRNPIPFNPHRKNGFPGKAFRNGGSRDQQSSFRNSHLCEAFHPGTSVMNSVVLKP